MPGESMEITNIIRALWKTTAWAFIPMFVGSIVLQSALSDWRWDNQLFHVLVEGGGALIGFGLALIVAGMIYKQRLPYNHVWLIACFLSMGTLDMAHALVAPGQVFVWLHSTATFIGGLFAALVWVSSSISKLFFKKYALIFLVILSLGFSLWSFSNVNATLPMLDSDMSFSTSAVFLNISGGLGFLVAWLYFVRSYYLIRDTETFYFANHFCLFAMAGLLFELSVLWDSGWWFWHALRAFAYILLIIHFGMMYWSDVTELAKLNIDLEGRVRARTVELNAIIKGSPSAIITASTIGDIESFSPAAEKIFGWSAMQAIGMNFNILLVEHKQNNSGDCVELLGTLAVQGTKFPNGREVVAVKRDGTAFPVILAVNRIDLPDKNLFVAIINDISEQKRTQKQLIQNERLASLGQMVAGISHEINSPLGTAVTNVSEIKDRTTHFEKELIKGISKGDMNSFLQNIKDYSFMAEENLARAAKLVRSFKSVAIDQSSEEKRTFDIKENIESTLITLDHEFKQTAIAIVLNCDNKIIISSFPGIFSQIISNLVLNSLVHGFDNGKDEGVINIKIIVENEQLVLSYQDTGKGLDKLQREKIFEPFFTTRRNQGGTGLGMHVVHNLVTDILHGAITLRSHITQGINLQICVPMSEMRKGT